MNTLLPFYSFNEYILTDCGDMGEVNKTIPAVLKFKA